ncbi:MAG TPA: hypothetical protein VNT22_11805 [Baekduia sp.]|nr:hypothetical protein [Baekduia sp.]
MTEAHETEIAALRARVAELEAELHQQAQAVAATRAEAQEKLYWLERMHLDVEQVMHTPAAGLVMNVLRRVRGVVWAIKRIKRRIAQD